jgi:hypothetical protein
MVTKHLSAAGIGLAGLALAVGALAQTPLDSAFTYQGQLRQAGAPVTDSADFRFSLWDAYAGGNQIGTTQSLTSVEVTNGLFTVWLDFGSTAFAGEARYLEMEVRVPAGSGAYTLLTPRQEIGAVPYALYALDAPSSTDADTVDSFHANTTPTANTLLPLNGSAKFPLSVLSTGAGSGLDADLLDSQHGAFYRDASNLSTGTLPGARLSGVYSSVLTLSNPSNVFVGDGAGVTNLYAGNLATGTVADARLSPNVALLDSTQTFSGAKTFSAAPGFTAAGAPFSVTSNTLVTNLNADLLDGQTGSFYQNAANLNAGLLPDARLSGTYTNPLTFSNASNSFTGSGLNLTNLNASNLASGTVPDGRLSSNVALLNTPQTFTANKYFTGSVGIGTTTPGFPLTFANTLGDKLSLYGQSGNHYGFGIQSALLQIHGDASNSDIAFGYGSSAAFTERMRIKGSGNVGIGRTDPSYRLHVEATGADDNPAIYGKHESADHGIGVRGRGGLYGLYGEVSPTGTGQYLGVYGVVSGNPGYGKMYGVDGYAYGGTEAYGVYGSAAGASTKNYGVYGRVDSGGYGVYGVHTASTGPAYGMYAESASTSGGGLFACNTATSGWTVGVYGKTSSSSGKAVYADASSTSGTSYGVYAENKSTGAGATAVYGYASGASGATVGIYGVCNSANGYAGAFTGKVDVNGSLRVYSNCTINSSLQVDGNCNINGTLTKGGGSFKIDHPLDPENKYLYHSFVESPDMMNVYNGNVTTAANGYATITLPKWFETLNRDFRYQLTVIGQFAQAIVAEEINNNQFVIRSDKPNVKVSWQVTGIRQDPFASANRIPVEEDKPAGERGKYLYPAAYGQAEDLGIDATRDDEKP